MIDTVIAAMQRYTRDMRRIMINDRDETILEISLPDESISIARFARV